MFSAGLSTYYVVAFPKAYERVITCACNRFGVDVADVYAIAWTESKFSSTAKSGAGAIGIMQVMPTTAKWCAEALNMEYKTEKLYDAEYNITLGVFYYSYLLKKFGDKEKALSAYNAGEGNVLNWMQNPPYKIHFRETVKYVKKVQFAIKIYDIRVKR